MKDMKPAATALSEPTSFHRAIQDRQGRTKVVAETVNRTVAVVLLVAWLGGAAGCTYAARLYDVQAGGPPIAAKFKWSGSGRGKIEATLPSGKVLSGEYVTVADDAMSWGTVFAAGATINGYAVTTQGQQRGSAIVTGQGTTIQCEYVTGAASPSGYGSCTDNQGNIYKLMF